MDFSNIVNINRNRIVRYIMWNNTDLFEEIIETLEDLYQSMIKVYILITIGAVIITPLLLGTWYIITLI